MLGWGIIEGTEKTQRYYSINILQMTLFSPLPLDCLELVTKQFDEEMGG